MSYIRWLQWFSWQSWNLRPLFYFLVEFEATLGILIIVNGRVHSFVYHYNGHHDQYEALEVVLQLKELLFVRYTRAVISLGLLLGFVGPLSLVNICYSFAMELLYYHKVLM